MNITELVNKTECWFVSMTCFDKGYFYNKCFVGPPLALTTDISPGNYDNWRIFQCPCCVELLKTFPSGSMDYGLQ